MRPTYCVFFFRMWSVGRLGLLTSCFILRLALGSANRSDDVSSSKSVENFINCIQQGDQFETFCWLGIEIRQPEWIIFSTSNATNEFEKRIAPHCRNPSSHFATVNNTYGFSFIESFAEEKYIDDESGEMGHPVILSDVFYICCWSTHGCLKHLFKAVPRSYEDVEMVIARLLVNELRNPPSTWQQYTQHNQNVHGNNMCLDAADRLVRKPKGTYACFFFLDTNSEVRTYAGPFVFNNIDLERQTTQRKNVNSVATLVNTKQLCKPHEGATEPSYLNDGECLKFASSLDYFIYCCCYEKMEPCGYLHNRAQSTHNMSLNFNEWTTDFGLTSYKSDSKWTFASFLYSRRTEASHKNVRLWHCATGFIILWPTVGGYDSTTERISRTEMPSPAEHCMWTVFFLFRGASQAFPSTIALKMESDERGLCTQMGEHKCFILTPRYSSSSQLESFAYSCCCSESDLCNHMGNSDQWKQEVRDIDKFSKACSSYMTSFIQQRVLKREAQFGIACFKFFDMETKEQIELVPEVNLFVSGTAEKNMFSKETRCDEFAYLPIEPNVTGSSQKLFTVRSAFYCSCLSNGTPKDRDGGTVNETMSIPSTTKLPQQNGANDDYRRGPEEEPFCDTNLTLELHMYRKRVCLMGAINRDSTLQYENEPISEEEAKGIPLCYLVVHLGYENQFSFRYGIVGANYTAFLSMHDRVRATHRRYQYLVTHNSTFLIYTCFASAGAEPCNGVADVINQLKRAFALRQRTARTLEPLTCPLSEHSGQQCHKTRDGCFLYQSLVDNNIAVMGCIDILSDMVRMSHWSAELQMCSKSSLLRSKVNTDCYALESMKGVLCCCSKNCEKELVLALRRYGYYPRSYNFL